MNAKKRKTMPAFVPYLLIIIGTAVMAVAIQGFFDPSQLATGGFTGIAILIKAITVDMVKGGVPLWLTNIILNVPVFILAYIFLGFTFVKRTIVGAGMLSAWLYIIPAVDFAKGDMLLASIYGGALLGVGIGLVIRANATTGGTDMVSALLKLVFRQFSIAQIMMVLDAVIVVAGFAVFGLNKGLYACIAIVLTTKVSDSIVDGLNLAKTIYIVTDKEEEVADAIMKIAKRGVTSIDATGMYTKQRKNILYVVVSKKELLNVKQLVRSIDEDAFIVVSDANEVHGEGFFNGEDM